MHLPKLELELTLINCMAKLDFIKYFYGVTFSEKEKNRFLLYSKTLSLKKQKYTLREIGEKLQIPKSTVEKWLFSKSKPMLARLYDNYLELGSIKNKKWISIDSTRGGLFTGRWIKVPEKISRFQDILDIVKQTQELESVEEKSQEFNFYLQKSNKHVLFGYLLGFMLGDAGKPSIFRKNRTNRRLTIRLTKRFESNKRLGDFVSMCANSLGLKMKHCKDCPPGKRNTFPFYTWISQSSTFIQWMFDAGLGLNDKETTTYNQIKADWIVESPNEFKIGFLQGLADSDGFIDFSSKRAGIITHPNTDLISKIFYTLSINHKKWFLTRNKLWVIMISIKDAYELPLFNPYIKTYRFERLEKLFHAKKFPRQWPEWLSEKIGKNLEQGINGTKLVEKILNEDGISIGTKQLRIHHKKIASRNGGNMSKKQKIVCLGIESTAR